MATLNLSTNGPSITKSYQSIVDAPTSSGNASKSPTYGIWAIYSVSAPLANAFQQDIGGKESVLKVQSTGEGELVDLIDELSDGRVQFAFTKVKDPNTMLPKSVLIGWCGEGVPERTKGYFTSHLAAVSRVLHGYHVQLIARSDRDLTPELIVKKVSDASGSRYSGGGPAQSSSSPSPPIPSKSAFTPTRSSGGGAGGFNPLAGSRVRPSASKDVAVDEDGWGQDAPPVTRTQLEKVQSSYQPTKVNMRDLSSQSPESSRFNGTGSNNNTPTDDDVVRGGYQPVGKVDIAALRRQAQEKGNTNDERPNVVKGSYEPVGKVDIAAIRARAQIPAEGAISPPSRLSPTSLQNSTQVEEKQSFMSRSVPFSASERLTSLPKPKVTSRFGSGTSSFTGTNAPRPGGFGSESKPALATPAVGAGRTFADQGGKTPAQLWAEKKARERGLSGADHVPPPSIGGSPSHIANQNSGEWKSGYEGKSWAPVQTTRTGQSSSILGQQRTGQEEDGQPEAPNSPAGGVEAIRDRFKGAPPMGASNVGSGVSAPSPPPLDTSSKPNAGHGIPIPGLAIRQSHQENEDKVAAPQMPTPPAQPPRSPTPPTPPSMDSGSPIRVAMPVSRGHKAQEVEDAREEQLSPPPAMPARSLAQAIPREEDLTEEPTGHDPARDAGEAAAAASFDEGAVEAAQHGAHETEKRALVQYDYEKAEDNELELKEGEYVTNIDMVDDDWWMGHNSRGETGLFPSNYVELIEGNGDEGGHTSHQAEVELDEKAAGTAETGQRVTATALYEYEAAEGNELGFPENAKITGVEFPDEDWWSGEYGGRQGLFPSNYVLLDE